MKLRQWWVVLVMAVTVCLTQGCGSFTNVVFGPPNNYADDAYKKEVTPDDPRYSITDEGRNTSEDETRNPLGIEPFLPVHASRVYGGILYDFNWISHEKTATKVLGVVDLPFSFAGDTLTAPFILVFGTRYMGVYFEIPFVMKSKSGDDGAGEASDSGDVNGSAGK